MPNYNKVIFAGHLTRDPQLKFLPSQVAVAEFGMACNRKFNVGEEHREEVTFIDCTCFGKGAEVINQYCQKGKALLIDGRLKFDSWEDRNGGRRSKLSVVVENFQFLGGAAADGEQPPRQHKATAGAFKEPRPAPAESPLAESVFTPDEIPF